MPNSYVLTCDVVAAGPIGADAGGVIKPRKGRLQCRASEYPSFGRLLRVMRTYRAAIAAVAKHAYSTGRRRECAVRPEMADLFSAEGAIDILIRFRNAARTHRARSHIDNPGAPQPIGGSGVGRPELQPRREAPFDVDGPRCSHNARRGKVSGQRRRRRRRRARVGRSDGWRGRVRRRPAGRHGL